MNYFDFSTIIGFENMIMNNFKLKGISNIEESDVREERAISFDKEGNIVKGNQYVIDTEGINLKDIRNIIGIDIEKSIVSDVVMIYRYYGIEAARTAIVVVPCFFFTGEDAMQHPPV